MMELAGLAASIIMGLSLGLIGGGGSILTVPILVYLFKVDPILATAYSLLIVGVTALVGGIQSAVKGEVDFKRGIIFAIPSFVGVYMARAVIVPSLPNEIFSIGSFIVTKPILIMSVFAVLMVVASVVMIKPSVKKVETVSNNKKLNLKSWLAIGAEGLIVGSITGFVGAGGGFLIIPALVILTGMSMKLAIGTSLMIIASKSLIGFIGDLQKQNFIEWSLLFKISAIAVTGLFIGSSLKSKISEHSLKKGFGWFVLAMGLFVLYDQLAKI